MRLRRLLHVTLWPLLVLTSALAFAFCFERGWIEASLALVPAAAFVLLFGLEFAVPDRRGEGAWRDPQAWNDLLHNAVGQGFGNALGQAVFVAGAALLAAEIGERWGGSTWPAHWPLGAQALAGVFVADGLDYARHRLMHGVSWLWPAHALHHSVDRLNVLKSGRGHILDMLLRSLLVYAPLALLGAPRTVLLAYAAAVVVFGPIAHANVRVQLPGFLHRLVLTPQVHRIHHARPLALSRCNYANVFPFWDLIGGTFAAPERQEPFAYGIEGDTMPADFVGQALEPFRVRAGAAQRPVAARST